MFIRASFCRPFRIGIQLNSPSISPSGEEKKTYNSSFANDGYDRYNSSSDYSFKPKNPESITQSLPNITSVPEGIYCLFEEYIPEDKRHSGKPSIAPSGK